MKRFISIFVSALILAILYNKIDFPELIKVFQGCDPFWMVVSLGMVVPITFFSGWRLKQLIPVNAELGIWEANKLILAASVLNMVLPSKMGDIAKSYFMKERGNLSGTLSLSIVIFEKACDMLSLLLWCGFGLLLYPQKDAFFWTMTAGILGGLILGLLMLGSKGFSRLGFTTIRRIAPGKIGKKLVSLQDSWDEMHDYFWGNPAQLTRITAMSIFVWVLHLLQIWFFILALNAWAPPVISFALSPLALLAGLLPLTFAGVGTRDAALVALYAPYFSAATGAALGVLCTSRYFLPAIGGLPFLNQYLSTVKQFKKA
ncbi:MAG: lysylphosphatidylglycerol synthase transmembrane domain-containing protein [Cyanobacteria bacterium P01_F01_bin.116]